MPTSAPSAESCALAGKVALVTGGARRVGAAIALALAREGCDVAITCRRSGKEASQVVRQIQALGRRALVIRVELADPRAADRIHRQFTRQFDRLDILVNNASGFEPGRIGAITVRDFDRQMAVNARTPLLLIQKFAPMLAAHAKLNQPATLGRIVNFIDIHVIGQPLKGYMAYNLSKAALHEITMTAAMELAPRITVNAIAPGVVQWAPSYTPAQRRQYMKRVPLGRPGTPQDAAAAVLYLVREGHYCTGQVIRLDGGRLLT